MKRNIFSFLSSICFFLYYCSIANAQYSISGNFTYNNSSNTPLDSIMVYLMQNGTKLDSIQADINGYYAFHNVTNGTYNVTATTGKPWAGAAVNVTDAVKVKRHFSGAELFTTSYRLHAGDVNMSMFINLTDAVKITRRFAGSDTSFVRGDWVFEKQFGGDTINVSCPGLNDTVVVNNANVIQDFKGVCVGDVNGSYNSIPTGNKGAKIKLNSNHTINLDANEYYDLPIISNDDVKTSAISLILDYPKNNVDIIDVNIIKNGIVYTVNTDTNLVYIATNNELRIGWGMDTVPLDIQTGDTLFIIRIKTSSTFSNGDNIKFDIANNVLCEFADENIIPINDVKLETNKIEFGNSSKGTDGIIINNKIDNINTLTLAPNPANEIIKLYYIIADNSKVNISLYNILGIKVKDIVNQYLSEGEYKIEVNLSSFKPGVYYCKMIVDGKNIIVKKVIISK